MPLYVQNGKLLQKSGALGTSVGCCCGSPYICSNNCQGIDSRGFPRALQLEISNFSGSLGAYSTGSPDGVYTVPTIHDFCSTPYTAGSGCPFNSSLCGVYRKYLEIHDAPSVQVSCCGGQSGKSVSPTVYTQVDMTIEISREQRMPNVPVNSGLAVYYDGLVSCCSNVVGFNAGGTWTYTQSQWLQMLCNRTLDLSGVATGNYQYRTFFGVVGFGSVSFDYRITVNDLP